MSFAHLAAVESADHGLRARRLHYANVKSHVVDLKADVVFQVMGKIPNRQVSIYQEIMKLQA